MSNPDLEIKNHLLAALPRQDYEELLPRLKHVVMNHGDVLFDMGEDISDAYFPSDSVISLVYTTRDGTAVEVGLVGMEGMVGLPIILGAQVSPYRAIVQVPDSAVRIKASDLKEAFKKTGPFQDLLHRYTHGMMLQISRTAVWHRIHTIEERLARWLLMVRDRMPSDEFRLTHEFIADMLGVRRAGVTLAAGALQRSGLIR